MSNQQSKWQHAALIGGILLVALNLRGPITGISPLAERMNGDGVSRAVIGSMTGIPLVLFSLVGIWAGWIGKRIGFARALGLGLLVLSIGCWVRSVPGDGAGFYRIAGTILIGAGIAVGNVLLPGLVKSRYPGHVGLLTSLYATSINIGATCGIAFAVPMADFLPGEWRGSLAAWGLFSFIILMMWSPQMIPRPAVRGSGSALSGIRRMAARWRAWQVMLFLGFHAGVYYCSVGWFPTLLQERGMAESEAAGWVSVMQVLGCVASLVVPFLAGKRVSQSGWVVACTLSNVVGTAGVLLLPLDMVGAAVLLVGFGINGGFGMVLLLLAMRSRTPEAAAGLSAFVQAGAYLMASPFPWICGWISTTAGGWPLAFGMVLVLAIASTVFGWLAGRPGELDD